MIRAVICDDEPLVLIDLQKTLESLNVEISGVYYDGKSVIGGVKKLNPDVLFLDIQMPGLNGFDVLELLGDEAPPVIFITAYDSYAIRAFNAAVFDYLLKPVEKERLQKSLNRLTLNEDHRQRNRHLLQAYNKVTGGLSRLLINEGNKITVIPVQDIYYFEAQADYVQVFSRQGIFTKHSTLTAMENQLPESGFLRIHRSYLINLNYVLKIEKQSKDQRMVIMKNDKSLPVSRAGYQRLAGKIS
jgi:two-component system LytT family response regulator